ncbi:MAG: MoaD/ThiS family protein [Candidatus Omnitrophica bacterium]|nr:Sulfur carrier protein CysO [bacterium]NUN98173.1 MoaD/ThiS family protein [Candidatus Omnitrophota bacterium]
MAVKVRIPTPLQNLTERQGEVTVSAATVGEALTILESQFPGLRERLRDDSGKLRRFINLYVNDEDIRFLQNEETPLRESDEISIVPAIAGG